MSRTRGRLVGWCFHDVKCRVWDLKLIDRAFCRVGKHEEETDVLL